MGVLRHHAPGPHGSGGDSPEGDHEAVQGWPEYFLPADTPDDELIAHQRREYASEMAKASESARQTNPERDVRILETEPLRDEHAVVAIRRAGVQSLGRIHDQSGELRTVEPGHKLPRRHPMMKRDPDAFVDVTNGGAEGAGPRGAAADEQRRH